MDQKNLHSLEAQCVQEESPRCQAACPLHVDARALCAHLAAGRVEQAWAVLTKTLPLPGVLARICDAPCEKACLRGEIGGGVRLGALERFCAENAVRTPRLTVQTSRNKRAAVLGSGLAGLCAAWELARKGFGVTLHGPRVQGLLAGLAAPVLPPEVLERELARLAGFGVVRAHDEPIPSPVAALEEYGVVFVDPEACPGHDFGEVDALSLGTQTPGLFSGAADAVDMGSPIALASLGRRAANSMERFVQGASLTSGREMEGPHPTRLFTNIENVAEALPVPVPPSGYSPQQAGQEAQRCIRCECMECVRNCVYLQEYKSYPRVYVRRIYNNAAVVMGTRQANQMINSCMLCGLCETICPEDFPMADICLQARRGLVEQGHMPPSAHEFALRDMAFANGGKSALARHAPGESDSKYLFFPGCQLTASDPDGVVAAYDDLRLRLGKVGLLLRCCGEPANWAGREELFGASMAELEGQWRELGEPMLIVACPTCLKTLRRGLPRAQIQSHWTILRALGLPQGVDGKGGRLAVNDPCAARHDAPQREDVRAILEQLDVETVEPALTGELTECCGYGGLLSEANPPLGLAAAAHRGAVVSETFVTYCAMCRDMFARAGKKALHLYDLLYPQAAGSAAQRENRAAPGYSARRENRARLREELLRTLWRESGQSVAEPFEAVGVEFSEDAARVMEERRILKSDVQKVLLQARESGRRFVSSATGRSLVSLRPVSVTYWVEFEENGQDFVVHNAWSHRMNAKGT